MPDEPVEASVKYPDLMDEANLWEWAGISLGTTETYRLYLSIKKFAETLPGDVEKIRFFGKISSRGAPYYILEGLTVEEEEEDKKDLDPKVKKAIEEEKKMKLKLEEGKDGANKYTYWVTQNFESGIWTALPNVTLAQV